LTAGEAAYTFTYCVLAKPGVVPVTGAAQSPNLSFGVSAASAAVTRMFVTDTSCSTPQTVSWFYGTSGITTTGFGIAAVPPYHSTILSPPTLDMDIAWGVYIVVVVATDLTRPCHALTVNVDFSLSNMEV